MRTVLALLATVLAAHAAFEPNPRVASLTKLRFPSKTPGGAPFEQHVLLMADKGISSSDAGNTFCDQLASSPMLQQQYELGPFMSECRPFFTRLLLHERAIALASDPLYYDESVAFDFNFLSKQLALSGIQNSLAKQPLKANFLARLMRENPNFKTVCETGFGTGHGSLLWLSSRPDVVVHAFDGEENPLTIPAHDYLDAKYPNRLTLYLGDVATTLPRFIELNPGFSCDVIHIGGHQDSYTLRTNLIDFRELANPAGHVVLLSVPDSDELAEAARVAWTVTAERGELQTVAMMHAGPHPDATADAANNARSFFNKLIVGRYAMAQKEVRA